MAKSANDRIERLIQETDSTIKQIEEVEREGGFFTVASEERVDREVLSKELRLIDEDLQPPADGSVSVTVSEDGMTARATFSPPTGDGKPVSIEEVEGMLSSLKIAHGIDWETIKETVFRCNGSRTRVADVVIARGTPSQDEAPAYLVVDAALTERPAGLMEAGGIVDHKGKSPFRLVSKGQVLARLVPKREGVPGSTVRGASVAYGKAPVAYPKSGNNTAFAGDVVVASCDGRFMLKSDSFWVNEVLDIKGDVDYSTGHVDFPGDIIINGEVKHGFNLSAGGSVYCRRVIDASEIVCKKDLETEQGIIGRKTGIVRVGGSIRAKYIESCYVEARGPIVIQTGCLNAMLNTLDRFVTGPRGVLVGGKVYAQNGITVNQIGTDAGPRTEIHCGIDFSIERKLTWIRDRNIDLAMKLKQVDAGLRIGAPTPALLGLRDKIRAAIHKLNEAAKSMVGSLDKNEEASVVVNGSIIHGSYIEICHVPYLVTSTMSRVRFFLDKERGKIAVEKLAAR